MSVIGDTLDISIHALREEGDTHIYTAAQQVDTRFLSTPSARRATQYIQPRML